MVKGLHTITIAEELREKTSFTTHCGLFQYERLPFGLANAPASFQIFTCLTLGRYDNKSCLVFMDDIIIMSTNFEEHSHDLQRNQASKVKTAPGKVQFCIQQISILGTPSQHKWTGTESEKCTS